MVIEDRYYGIWFLWQGKTKYTVIYGAYIQFWPTLFSSLQKPKLAFDPNDTGVNYTAGEVTIAICGLRLPERLALDSLLQEPAQVRLRIGAVYSIYLRAIIVSDVGIRCVTVHA
jgi:hypothetical protein